MITYIDDSIKYLKQEAWLSEHLKHRNNKLEYIIKTWILFLFLRDANIRQNKYVVIQWNDFLKNKFFLLQLYCVVPF